MGEIGVFYRQYEAHLQNNLHKMMGFWNTDEKQNSPLSKYGYFKELNDKMFF